MGYRLAGCTVIAANDIDPQMQKHYVENLNPPKYYLSPIGELIGDNEVDSALYDLDILDGSPPCSSFSMSGNREKDWQKNKKFREGQSNQVLDDLFFDYLKLVDKLRPKVAIAENVKGMLLGNAKGYVKAILAEFDRIGYNVQLFLIDAANCGVPQHRERVFFCAVRKDFSRKKLVLDPQSELISAKRAFQGLSRLTESEKKTSKFVKTDERFWNQTMPGSSYQKAAEFVRGKNSCFNWKKLNSETPSNTITGRVNIAHWKQKRKLTFRELKRLGSFPDDYWAESESLGGYMVGMSVPPLMAKTVAQECVETWLN